MNNRTQGRATFAFSLLGGTGIAAAVLGALAHSLPLTVVGVICASAGGVGAMCSQRGFAGNPSAKQAKATRKTNGTTSERPAHASGKATSAANITATVQVEPDRATAKEPADQAAQQKAEGSKGSLYSQPAENTTPADVETDAPIQKQASIKLEQDSAASTHPQTEESNEPSDSTAVARQTAMHESTTVVGSNSALVDPAESNAEDDSASEAQVEAENEGGAAASLSSHGQNAPQADEPQDDSPTSQEGDPTHFKALWKRLLGSSDPIAELKLVVGEIHQREIDADIDSTAMAPTAVETYLARRLDEAGLFDTSVELPPIRIVSPRRTHLFYLRTSGSMSYAAKLRVIAVEAALNAFCFVNRYFKQPEKATLTQVYQLYQGLTSSVCAQIPSITMELPREGEPLSDPDGEWMVREILGQAIETVQTPYRLTATYRSNVACGDVAIQVDLTPSAVFPGTAWVPELGIVPTTSDMRRQEASRYGLRMGIMLAACAFHASQRVRHVWVQGVVDTPSEHRCYYHARIDRSAFRWIEMDHIVDPISCLLCLGGTLTHENGILQPIEDGFSLDDERFCPPRRFEPVALSTRTLAPRFAHALGTTRVSGLAIDESEVRASVADDVVRRLNNSTEQNVRMILDLANQSDDSTVQKAAKRTASKLIEGAIADNDALGVREEFVSGDDLTQAVSKANEQLQNQEFFEATRTLETALAPIDEANTYVDNAQVVWRAFDSYVDRALYNRLHAGDKRAVKLVPHAYVEAHMALAVALLAEGDVDQALEHARRGHAVAPDSSWTSLNLVTCLQAAGKDDEAMGQLDELLKVAHDPQGIGLAYYQMAHLQWMRGNLLAARACFEHIPQYLGNSLPTLDTELMILMGENGGSSIEPLSDETSNRILTEHGIPVAPSEKIAHYFYEGLAASFDAEVFPVAKSFVEQLGQLSGDDVVMNVIRSVEGEPDE